MTSSSPWTFAREPVGTSPDSQLHSVSLGFHHLAFELGRHHRATCPYDDTFHARARGTATANDAFLPSVIPSILHLPKVSALKEPKMEGRLLADPR